MDGGDGADDNETTEKRKLHQERPLWASTPNRKAPTIRRPSARHYDAIVVGAGVSGALAAEALCDGTRRILVLDRRGAVEGSTMASTAMIQHEIDEPLHRLARLIGREKAGRAWRRSARAVESLRLTAERLGVACQMEAKQALFLAGDDVGARGLRTEVDLRTAEGLQASYLRPAELRDRFGVDRTAAIVSPVSASANPAQLAAGLLRAAVARGAEIAAPVEVTDFAETADTVVLATSKGGLVTADHAVFCTGYEFLEAMRHPAHEIVSTWALASARGVAHPDWLSDFLVWEASDPYLYFRTTPDGRVIVGGEDENDPEAYRDRAKLRRKARTIAEKLGDLTGIRLGRPDYAWAAPFGTTTTGLPIIGLVPGCARVQAVMGFGGNGITFSAIAAEIVSSRISGAPDEDEDLFRYPA